MRHRDAQAGNAGWQNRTGSSSSGRLAHHQTQHAQEPRWLARLSYCGQYTEKALSWHAQPIAPVARAHRAGGGPGVAECLVLTLSSQEATTQTKTIKQRKGCFATRNQKKAEKKAKQVRQTRQAQDWQKDADSTRKPGPSFRSVQVPAFRTYPAGSGHDSPGFPSTRQAGDHWRQRASTTVPAGARIGTQRHTDTYFRPLRAGRVCIARASLSCVHTA